ncbi:hypothetical protein CRI94_09430 [Longibacter salinarum]|uniref:AMP-activated protein kinase glycogen-binding domain-containing protein n=1 Tax=Longibacter salinarum TaxID=1850348 RepID=A0A2A8CXV2_9BACT|nr:hypothetical protein [Longibacter salinarum]PEN13525.1 hypothetical protein CRI94_09430 [Longibacter salinarum]
MNDQASEHDNTAYSNGHEFRSPADNLVQRLIDGDLSTDEETDALHAIAEDEEARSVLRFELQWSGEAARSSSTSPPAGFADNVMAAIEMSEATANATVPAADDVADSGVVARLQDWLRPLTVPLTLTVRPVVALLVAAALGVLVWQVGDGNGSVVPEGEPSTAIASGPSTSAPNGPQATAVSDDGSVVWMRFVYSAADAESVAVAGDFSKWEPIPLSSRTVRGQTIWTGLVPVGRGEHEYQFVINGETWVTDPLAPIQRDDGFGAQNAVLKL